MTISLQDRFKGSLLGLAIGDALGTTLEFKQPGSFKPISDIVGGGPFSLSPGKWTDDTSMALCLAESLIECNGFDPKNQMEKYVDWYRRGYWSSEGYCFDIGNTTREALTSFEKTGDPLSGSKKLSSAGNGSIMRLTPVVLAYSENCIKAIDCAAESSKTTHGAEECVDSCELMACIILGALNGLKKEEILSYEYLNNQYFKIKPLSLKVKELAEGSFKEKNPPKIVGSGYVIQSLEAALWAFYRSESFEEGALMAVNLGDDADTTGAVYGQIAGAYYGIENIPQRWKEVIYKKEEIEEISNELFDLRKKV